MYCITYVLHGIDVCFEMNVHGNNQKEMTWKICNYQIFIFDINNPIWMFHGMKKTSVQFSHFYKTDFSTLIEKSTIFGYTDIFHHPSRFYVSYFTSKMILSVYVLKV